MRLLKFALTRLRSERGQALVLAALAMVVLLGFAALSIDVGYWYSQKREVQKAVDAAALAGAQELPENPAQAEVVALDYLNRNGVSQANGDTVSVTFRRTNPEGDPSEWDSVVIEVERPAQAWFAKVFGIDEVLISDVRAVGSYFGGSSTVPVDVVQIIDRSSSMTDYDLANAKDGARALLEYFDASIQHVGLAVLGGGVSWANPCDSALPGVWLEAHLSDDFQSDPHVLNGGSRLVSTIDCLNHSSVNTNIGSPLEAAIEELQTNGRPDLTWGIILLTDGAANTMPSADTGYRSPTANAAAPGGDNNGFESTTYPATNAYADDSSYASDIDSGTSSYYTSCGATQKDRHVFYNYGISVPGGDNILGIEVRLDAKVSGSTTTRRMCVELSWDGGAHWTSAKTATLSTSWGTDILGDSGDNWGHTWTPAQLSDANFRVRITNVANSTTQDFYLDWAAVKVYHTPYSGPCAYAAEMGDAARAVGIEVFTIGYGIGSGDDCVNDHGSWDGHDAVDLMNYIATDSDHVFIEPTTQELRPIFEVIGSQLTSGARLVE